MIDANRRYTAAEKHRMEPLGYQFQEVTTTSDTESMFMVSGYRSPELPRGLSEHNAAGWERP